MKKLTNLSEIRRISADLFEKERAFAGDRKETAPAEISPGLREFCMSLDGSEPEFVRVVDDEWGLYGFCSDGVDLKVKADGGRPVFSWTVWEWPQVLWTAEFHAIWQCPDGRLCDITPKPGAEPAILFVPDLKFGSDFNFDDRPGNHRKRAYPDQDRISEAKEAIARLKSTQAIYEQKRADKAGVALEGWIADKLPVDPLPGLLDRFLEACDQHEDYFDSLGKSGEFTPDRKMVDLNNRRVLLQRAVYAELKRCRIGGL